jgi:hypothetical protein
MSHTIIMAPAIISTELQVYCNDRCMFKRCIQGAHICTLYAKESELLDQTSEGNIRRSELCLLGERLYQQAREPRAEK